MFKTVGSLNITHQSDIQNRLKIKLSFSVYKLKLRETLDIHKQILQ